MRSHHPILIVGAGLAGLTLARVLHVNGVDAVVLDRDAGPDARTQGGMLDIHEDTGQAALRAAGLHDRFLAAVLPGGQAARVLDRDARVRFAEPDRDGGRPEIDRGDLRTLLLDSLPAGVVRWNSTVVAVEPGRVRLADGTELTTDLLIGADGAWSRVRSLVSAARPVYAGISFVELDLLDADRRHPASAGLVGGGMCFALGDGKGLLAHRETDGSVHVYVAVRTDESWLAGIDFTDIESARTALLGEFADWSADLRRLIGDADGPLVPRPIHLLPVGHRWPATPGVTLLGDAAHLMSPFAGEGANLALADGADLAAALLAHPGDTAAALRDYEEPMLARAEIAAQESADGLELLFGAGAPDGLVDMFTRVPV